MQNYPSGIFTMGDREIEQAEDLLRAYRLSGRGTGNNYIPDGFSINGTSNFHYDSYNDRVLLINEDNDALIEYGGDIFQFYSTPYNGYSGTAIDICQHFIDNHKIWHEDDIEYLFETILPDSKAAIVNEEFEFDKIAKQVETIGKKYNYVKKNDDGAYKLT